MRLKNNILQRDNSYFVTNKLKLLPGMETLLLQQVSHQRFDQLLHHPNPLTVDRQMQLLYMKLNILIILFYSKKFRNVLRNN